jgi:4-amino-4-deoxy-L-arabinose transferase-like glycosyltransferase
MWAAFPMAFFTISKSKLPGYILPVLAPCMLLLAALLCKLVQQNKPVARLPLMGIGALFASSAIWAFHDLYQFLDYSRAHWAFVAGPFFVVFFSVPAIIGGIVTITAALLGRVRLAQTVAVISFLLMLVTVQDALRKFNMDLSARIAASEIAQVDALKVHAFRMQRSWLYQLDFYLHREIPQWTPELPGVAIVVLPRKAVPELKKNAKVLDVIYDFSEGANILRVVPLNDSPSR